MENLPEQGEPTRPIKTSAEVTRPISTSSSETRPIHVNETADPPVKELEFVTAEPEVERSGDGTPQQKPRRSPWIWLGILVMLILITIGVVVGYGLAIKARRTEAIRQIQLITATQFELGLQDQRDGNLEMARQRFEYVLYLYPDYPGIDAKLVEIGIAIGQEQGGQVTTPQPQAEQTAITTVPTKNTQSSSILLRQAQNQLAAADWQGLYQTVMNMRNIDPEYEPVKVDGLFYTALRNMGIYEIQAGNLEVGLYLFSLAEQLAPIDTDAEAYRTWARFYITAGSWWGINWENAVAQFAQLYTMVPNLTDSSGYSVTRRYAGSLEGYGDFLQMQYDWCGSVAQYEKAVSIYSTEALVKKVEKSRELCANPPPTPTPTLDPYAPTPTPTKKPKSE